MQIKSPLIVKLQKELRAGNSDALHSFWEQVSRTGTPLIEVREGQQDLLVTFLYRQEEQGNHMLLLGTPANFDALNHRFVHLPGTDLWYLTLALPPKLRTLYGILPHAPFLPPDFADHPDFALLSQFFAFVQNQIKADPLNPRNYTIPTRIWLNPKELHLSRLELPKAPSQPWVQCDAKIPKGSVTRTRIKSHLLGNERNVWLYVPAQFPDEPKEHGLLLLSDGDAYTSIVDVPTLLDNLIYARKIPPLISVLFDNPDDPTRDRELGCNPLMPQFIKEELLPFVLDPKKLAYDPAKTVIAGSSFGGLAAFYAGMHAPTLFPKILSLSGHLGWGAEQNREDLWIISQYAKKDKLPLEIYFSVGSLETGPPTFDRKPSFLTANRAMRDLLQSKGYHYRYHEYYGGHDYLCWQQELAEGLIYLFNY